MLKVQLPFGNGRSILVSIRSIPLLLVSLTGGAGGLSSSLDILFKLVYLLWREMDQFYYILGYICTK